MTWLLVLTGAGVLLVVFFLILIANAMPADLQVVDADETQVTEDMLALLDDFKDLGFELAGPLLRVEARPPVLLLPLLHAGHNCYGAVYRTGTTPAKTVGEFVTMYEPLGGLTTSPAIESGAMPAPPRVFYQVIPGAPPAALLDAHLRGVAFLRSGGLPPKRVTEHTYIDDLRAALALQRAHFFRRPIRNMITTIRRAATQKTPHLGPVADQADTSRRLTAITGGAAGG